MRLLFVFFLLLFGLLLNSQNSAVPTPTPRAVRLENLYAIAVREFLPLPLPTPPPCSFASFAVSGTHTDLKKWLAEAAMLRENGAAPCALQWLEALRVPAASRPADQMQWLYELALTLTSSEQIDSAISVSRQLTALADRSGQFQGWAWLTEAKAYHQKRRFSETYRLAEQSLQFARTNGDKPLQARALEVIGNVSRDIYMTRPEKSVPPLLEAVEIARALRDTDFVIGGLTGISLHYMDTDVDRALDFLEQAMALMRPNSPPRSRQTVLLTLSYFFQIQTDFTRSNLLLERAIALSKRLGRRSSVQNNYEQMAKSYMTLGDANKAQACLDSAYLYCNFQRELGYFYRSFAEVAVMKGDLRKACDWYAKAFDEQVNGYSNRNTQQLTEWETRFRTREKELQLEEQKRQRWLWITLVLALAGLFFAAMYAFFQQRKSQKSLALQHALIEQQAAELLRLAEAKSRFFANISHELRTPLTLMVGPLGSMLKAARLDARDVQLAKMAQQNGKQLLSLVNEILDLSKMESGKMKLQETAVSLQPFLRRVVSAFESHAERLGIHFVFEYKAAERMRVLLDEDKLRKVLNNLLSNALKFTEPDSGGTISVRVEDINNRIRLCVEDTGRGIHPDDLPHVFERFFQTRQADAPAEGGTGIGLALCREFAEVMGGHIWVSSTLGGGSRFYFEIPKKEVPGTYQDDLEWAPAFQMQKEKRPMSLPAAPQPPQRHHILLVEDNESLRDYVRLILGGKYHVEVAGHGRAALKRLAAVGGPSALPRLPDLIISDVMMPIMDGFQLIESLKSDDRYRSIPVVMLTARADLQDKLKALRIGVDDYLLKPFEEEELLARVENLLKNAWRRAGKEAVDSKAEAAEDSALSPVPAPPALSPKDLAWLAELEKMVAREVGNSQFHTDALADAMLTSRTKFYQQVKRLTGMTPNEYVQEVRFNKARMLLEERSVASVKAASGAVGFRDVEYFSKQFRTRFGKAPSEYLA